MFESTKDSFRLALCLDNIANIYASTKQFDRSLEYHRKALAITQVMDENAYCESLNALGSFFAEIKDYDSSLIYLSKSLDLAEKINNSFIVSVAYLNIGEVMKQTGKYETALGNLKKSVEISKTTGQADIVKKAYELIYQTYTLLSDPENSFEYYKLFSSVKDSMFLDESQRQVNEMYERFDTEKKDAEIDLLSKEKEKKEIWIYIYAVGTVLLVLLGIIILISNSRKRRSNRLLASQNDIINRKNQDITDSINYARRIQQVMLPSSAVFEKEFSESFVLYKPKDIVSGDFYWWAKKQNDLFVAAADCTGHGVPGALMSLIGMNFFNQVVAEQDLSETHLILNELHKKVLHSLNNDMDKRDSKDGMDVALIKFNTLTKEMSFSGAVRPLYHFSEGTLHIIKGERYSIGGVKDLSTSYKQEKLQLKKNDSVYLFSDGFADQFGGPGKKKFMLKRFQQLLTSVQEKPMNEQQKVIDRAFEDWKGGNEQVDDVLVIAFRI